MMQVNVIVSNIPTGTGNETRIRILERLMVPVKEESGVPFRELYAGDERIVFSIYTGINPVSKSNEIGMIVLDYKGYPLWLPLSAIRVDLGASIPIPEPMEWGTDTRNEVKFSELEEAVSKIEHMIDSGSSTFLRESANLPVISIEEEPKDNKKMFKRKGKNAKSKNK